MGEKERNEGEGGIKVTDKRRFGREGEGGFGGGQDESPGQREDAAQSDSKVEGGEVPEKEADARESGGTGGEVPRMDFATFVLSLATSAQVHLGA
ncbi:MAG TPA: hypothetical protein PLZ86_07200, partial [bacterium]|nr:hypothetical protein [bacterium]